MLLFYNKLLNMNDKVSFDKLRIKMQAVAVYPPNESPSVTHISNALFLFNINVWLCTNKYYE